MAYEMVWTDTGVEITMTGVLTSEEAKAIHDSFSSDSRSDRARYQIHDIRELEAMSVPELDAEMIGATDAVQSLSTPSLKVAVLRGDERYDHIIEAYAKRLESTTWEVRVFLDEAEARAWVGEAI